MDATGPILQACLNGPRRRSAAHLVPETAAQIAADLAACIGVGAVEAHVHPRGPDGLESVAAPDMAAAIRAARPSGIPIGVSTQARNVTKDGMAAAIATWQALPDYASVNLFEDHAVAVRAALAERGIGCEAGVWSLDDVPRLANGPAPLRILIEINQQDVAAAIAEADVILAALDRAGAKAPRLLHGFDKSAWPLLRRAQDLGLSARIGFEDCLLLEDGRPARSNAELIAEAVRDG